MLKIFRTENRKQVTAKIFWTTDFWSWPLSLSLWGSIYDEFLRSQGSNVNQWIIQIVVYLVSYLFLPFNIFMNIGSLGVVGNQGEDKFTCTMFTTIKFWLLFPVMREATANSRCLNSGSFLLSRSYKTYYYNKSI